LKKIIVLFITFNSISFQLSATAVIVLIFPGRIILSVDSRMTYTDNLTGKRNFRTECKLSTVNNFAYSFTGYRGYSGNVSAKYGNFNTDTYIKKILIKQTISLNQTFSELVDGLEKELTSQMKVLRKLNFKDYNHYFKENNGNFINLIVIGNDNGIPFAFALNATLTELNGTPAVKAKASVFENKTIIIHAGVTDAVAKYI